MRAAAALLLLTACGGEIRTLADCYAGEPRPLEVIVDPELPASPLVPLECTGEWPGGESPCTSIGPPGAAIDETVTIRVRPGSAFAGWDLFVDSTPTEARACIHQFTDVNPTDSPCGEGPIDCAIGGTIVLSETVTAASDTFRVALDLDFSNARTLTGSFSVELRSSE